MRTAKHPEKQPDLMHDKQATPSTQSQIIVRHFERQDVTALRQLMVELAVFERYDDAFAVTEQDIIDRGLGNDPQFWALVAHVAGKPRDLLGMLVYYFIPYTYDLSPEMVVKELYVEAEARGKRIGEQLMLGAKDVARDAGCKRIKWLVLDDNERAKQFYAGLGAQKDEKWENWRLVLSS